MKTNKLLTWNEAKRFAHDISGIDNPNLYLYQRTEGIYYPVKPIN